MDMHILHNASIFRFKVLDDYVSYEIFRVRDRYSICLLMANCTSSLDKYYESQRFVDALKLANIPEYNLKNLLADETKPSSPNTLRPTSMNENEYDSIVELTGYGICLILSGVY